MTHVSVEVNTTSMESVKKRAAKTLAKEIPVRYVVDPGEIVSIK